MHPQLKENIVRFERRIRRQFPTPIAVRVLQRKQGVDSLLGGEIHTLGALLRLLAGGRKNTSDRAARVRLDEFEGHIKSNVTWAGLVPSTAPSRECKRAVLK